MGVDFSHCGVSWGYIGFNTFREKLADEVGITLDNMIGFGGSLSWDILQDDIKPLLDHSDCNGELTPEECKKIAPRLRELVKNWPDIDKDKGKALELANGMDLAAENNECLQFL